MRLCRSLAILAVLTVARSVHASEPESIFSVTDDARSCSGAAISRFFEWSVTESRKATYNATNAEALAQANEEAFLACPESFLRTLASADSRTQDAVSYYFGGFEIERTHCALVQFEGVQDYIEILPRLQERSRSSATCDQAEQIGQGGLPGRSSQ